MILFFLIPSFAFAIEPVTTTAGLALAIGGLATAVVGTGIGVVGSLFGESQRIQELEHKEKFNMTIGNLQRKSLKENRNFNTKAALMKQNLTLGATAVDLSKKRIGGQGAAQAGFLATLYKTNQDLESLDREYLDKVSKLAVYEKSSQLAVEYGLSTSPVGYNVASDLVSGINKSLQVATNYTNYAQRVDQYNASISQ